MNSFHISAYTDINATAARIWDILTNPAYIKNYLGTDVVTDWKRGSPVSWLLEKDGQKFEDKGKVLENQENELLKFQYWTGAWGAADIPEHYSVITYRLEPLPGGKIRLTYTRENIPTEEEKKVFEQFLPYMLEGMKQMAEGK